MTSLLLILDPLRDWTAFASWQSFLFLGLAATSERFLRRSPWQAHWMLTAAIFASVLGPTASLLIFRYGGGVMSPGSIWALEKQAAGPASVLGPLILGGGFLFSLLLLHGIVSARRLMFQARPFPDRESQEALLEGSRMMRNVSLPILFTSPAVKSPTVWSWGLHPAVLLPERLSETLTPPERDAIFLHEMAHITRRDHWAALLTRFCGIFLFWNPLYWIALKLTDLAADRACDLLVLSREKVSPEIYGETLLRLAAGEKNRPILQYLSRKEQLMKRIDTILDFEENKKAFSVTRTPLRIFGMAMAVLFLVTAMAFCQEKREDPAKQPEKPSYEKTAEELVARFAGNDFSDDGFTQGMKDGQISDIAKALWDDFQKQFGPFVQSKTLKTESLLGFKRVHEQCEFQRGTAVLMVVVDKNDLVAGLFVMSAEKKEEYATPQGRYTHLVVFGPKGDFRPKNPMDYLNLVNPKLELFGVRCGYFRSKPVDGTLIAYNATSTPEEYQKLVESIPQLKYIETKRLTKEMFEEYEKTPQESLPSERLLEIEKTDWFQNLNDFQKAYTRWDENQFEADYDLRFPENESERKALEEKWITLLEGDEPVRTRYSGETDDFTRAIVGLAMLKSPKAKELLAKIAGERVAKDNAYRHTATKMLGELGDPAAIPDLIPLVYHFNFNTRADAQISLVRLSGQNFGSDAEAWGKWYNENRNKLGDGFPEFDPAAVDWSCGMNNAEIRFYSDPKNQKEMDDTWLRRQGGGVKKVQSYRVDKNIADIPEEKDFSTPETAYAAFERTMCVQEEKDYAKNVYEISVPDVKRDASKPLAADWAKVLLAAKILCVHRFGDDRAIVVAKLEGENVRKPFNVRWFKKIDGRWLNAGNDRVDSEEDAKELFVKRWAKEKPVPKIVKMEPENGAKDVDAEKTTELRVTFDIDMNTGGYSWCGGGDDFPGAPDGTPRWIDMRTCLLPAKLAPGKTFRLSINAPSFKNFKSADGVPVEPVPYSFTTKGAGE